MHTDKNASVVPIVSDLLCCKDERTADFARRVGCRRWATHRCRSARGGRVRGMAGALYAAGVRRGDRVAMALPNGLDAIVAFLAPAAAGTAAPLNPGYKFEEFCFYLADTHARMLMVPCEEAAVARQAAEQAGIPVVTPEISGGGSAPEPGPDDIALVLHTSGSTGRPKRVPLRHRTLAASTRNIAETYALGPGDRSLCLMPLFHVHGLM